MASQARHKIDALNGSIRFAICGPQRGAGEDALSAAAAARLRWWLKLPLRILQPAVDAKHCFRIAGVRHSAFNRGKLVGPFIYLDAADVLFGPRLIVGSD